MTPLSLYLALTPHRDWLRALPVDEQPASYVVPYVAQQVEHVLGVRVNPLMAYLAYAGHAVRVQAIPPWPDMRSMNLEELRLRLKNSKPVGIWAKSDGVPGGLHPWVDTIAHQNATYGLTGVSPFLTEEGAFFDILREMPETIESEHLAWDMYCAILSKLAPAPYRPQAVPLASETHEDIRLLLTLARLMPFLPNETMVSIRDQIGWANSRNFLWERGSVATKALWDAVLHERDIEPSLKLMLLALHSPWNRWWLDPQYIPTLNRLLPVDEYQRWHALPTMKSERFSIREHPDEELPQGEGWHDYHQLRRALFSTYCPAVYATIADVWDSEEHVPIWDIRQRIVENKPS